MKCSQVLAKAINLSFAKINFRFSVDFWTRYTLNFLLACHIVSNYHLKEIQCPYSVLISSSLNDI